MRLLTTIFHTFAANACQGNRAVDGKVVSVSFLVESGNIACFQSSGT